MKREMRCAGFLFSIICLVIFQLSLTPAIAQQLNSRSKSLILPEVTDNGQVSGKKSPAPVVPMYTSPDIFHIMSRTEESVSSTYKPLTGFAVAGNTMAGDTGSYNRAGYANNTYNTRWPGYSLGNSMHSATLIYSVGLTILSAAPICLAGQPILSAAITIYSMAISWPTGLMASLPVDIIPCLPTAAVNQATLLGYPILLRSIARKMAEIIKSQRLRTVVKMESACSAMELNVMDGLTTGVNASLQAINRSNRSNQSNRRNQDSLGWMCFTAQKMAELLK